MGYDPFDREGELPLFSEDEEDVNNIEYDPLFAKNLLTNLIDNLSDITSSGMRDSNVDMESGRRKRRLIDRENFDIDDIMGEFDIDDLGNILIDQVTLRDNLGRKVNKHGYLVNERGDILN